MLQASDVSGSVVGVEEEGGVACCGEGVKVVGLPGISSGIVTGGSVGGGRQESGCLVMPMTATRKPASTQIGGTISDALRGSTATREKVDLNSLVGLPAWLAKIANRTRGPKNMP